MTARLLALALAVLASGCTASVSLLQKGGAAQAASAATAESLVAERLLCAGYKPADVEAILRDAGLTPANAHKIVALEAARPACSDGR